MKNESKLSFGGDKLLKIVGLFYLLFGINAILFAVYQGFYSQVIWFCYVGLILIGLGFLFGKDEIILAQLSILAVPMIIWNIDFFYVLFSGDSLWGITDYFFEEGHNMVGKFISLQHIYNIPLALLALSFMNVKKGWTAWKLAFVEIGALFLIGRALTPASDNVNLIYNSPFPIEFAVPYWTIWFVGTFVAVLISNFVFAKVLLWK